MRCRSARRKFVPKNTSFTPDEIPPAQTSMSVVQRGATVQQKIPIQPLVLSLCCLRREIHKPTLSRFFVSKIYINFHLER